MNTRWLYARSVFTLFLKIKKSTDNPARPSPAGYRGKPWWIVDWFFPGYFTYSQKGINRSHPTIKDAG